jgi:hypothetical protein
MINEDELREWLKDHIVSYITTEGKSYRRVREYFAYPGPGERFKTNSDFWNRTPIAMKKWLFRTALEELSEAGVVRVKPLLGDLNHSTHIVVNDVLDIMSRLKR